MHVYELVPMPVHSPQYIKKKKFKRSPWNMDYTGTSKLRRKDRIDSRYYRKAKNAIIVDGGLKVEFHYVDPMSRRHNGGRDRTTLLIMCYDRHFKVYEPFPQTLCGKREIRERDRPGGGRVVIEFGAAEG